MFIGQIEGNIVFINRSQDVRYCFLWVGKLMSLNASQNLEELSKNYGLKIVDRVLFMAIS